MGEAFDGRGLLERRRNKESALLETKPIFIQEKSEEMYFIHKHVKFSM